MIAFEYLGLQAFSKNKQYLKYLNALNRFVKEKSQNGNISHIFVGGSFIKGSLNTFSDIDCCLVDTFDEIVKSREERDFIDGIKIDIIIVSRKSVVLEIRKEYRSFYRFFSTFLANSKKIYGSSDFDDVLKLAKKSALSKVQELTKEEITNITSFLDVQKRESKILYKKNDIIGFHLRLNHLIHSCVEYYFKLQQLPKPSWKRISESIENKKFFELLHNSVIEKDLNDPQKVMMRFPKGRL